MRWQPGRSPEEGTSLSTADARRRTVSGRCRGRRRRRGSLFAASAGSSAVPPSSPPPSPSPSDGTRTSWTGGTANAPAGVHLSGLVSVGTGHLRLNCPGASTLGVSPSSPGSTNPRHGSSTAAGLPLCSVVGKQSEIPREENAKRTQQVLAISRTTGTTTTMIIDCVTRLASASGDDEGSPGWTRIEPGTR